MKTAVAAKLLVAASVCIVLAMPAQGNFLANPGFEDTVTGTLPLPSSTPLAGIWYSPYVAGSFPGYAAVVTGSQYSGNQALQVTSPSSVGTGQSVFQELGVSLTPGGQYVLDFWAMTTTPGPAGQGYVRADLGPLPWQSVTVPIASGYSQYTLTLTAPTSGTTRLRINWSPASGPLCVLYLDDVSLTVVPEPSTVALLLLPLGVRFLRKFGK